MFNEIHNWYTCTIQVFSNFSSWICVYKCRKSWWRYANIQQYPCGMRLCILWSIFVSCNATFDIYCKQTFIRENFISWFAGDELVCDDYFSRQHLNRTCFHTTPIRQRLIHGEKYSRWRGSRESRKYFLHANKSWLTVFVLEKVLFIWF